MGFVFGPFDVIDETDINPSFFVTLKKAYRHNMNALNEDLRNLDRQLNETRAWNGRLQINPSENKIWAWTWAIPRVEDIKVVIVGNKPTNEVQSSGLAFHPLDNQNVSHSVREIFNLMSQKFDLDIPNNGYENYSLERWISNGVLLVNAMTTQPTYGREGHSAWIPIMSKFFNFIHEKMSHVIFMLVGSVARNEFYHRNSDGLEERERPSRANGNNQRVVMAHHPSYSGQYQNNEYKTFAQGIATVYYLLRMQGNQYRINFKDLHMFDDDCCSTNSSYVSSSSSYYC